MNRACPFPINSVFQFPLWFLGRKRIHNRRPSCINPFEDESSIVDGTIHEKSLGHVWFVRVQVDEPPRSQYRCGKQNGELSFLSHVGTPVFWDDVQVGKAGKGTLLFLVPQVHEEFDRRWPMSGVVIVRIGENLEVSYYECPKQFDPICEVLAAVNDSFVPCLCYFFDSLAVAQPADINEARSNQVKAVLYLPRPGHK